VKRDFEKHDFDERAFVKRDSSRTHERNAFQGDRT